MRSVLSLYTTENPDTMNMVLTASLVSSSLSLLGSLFVIFFFIRYKETRTFASLLVFQLNIADFGEALIHLSIPYVYNTDNPNLCVAQGFLSNFFNLCSVFWTSVIAFSIYKILHDPNKNIQAYQLWFRLFAFVLPLVISFLPIIWNQYGSSPGWCWIKSTETTKQMRIIFTIVEFYGPLWISFSLNLFFYWRSSMLIRKALGKNYDLNTIQRLR
jgi:hypothetical protein